MTEVGGVLFDWNCVCEYLILGGWTGVLDNNTDMGCIADSRKHKKDTIFKKFPGYRW